MDIGRLAYMANQIARNFDAIGHDDAVSATADHIATFWDPRMKAAIIGADAAALSPVAAEAVRRLAVGREPPPQTRATKFNAVDEVGRSDAG